MWTKKTVLKNVCDKIQTFKVWNLREYCKTINIVSNRRHQKAINQSLTHLITKNFDLTITSVGNSCVSRILKRVDLYVQRKTLDGWIKKGALKRSRIGKWISFQIGLAIRQICVSFNSTCHMRRCCCLLRSPKSLRSSTRRSPIEAINNCSTFGQLAQLKSD